MTASKRLRFKAMARKPEYFFDLPRIWYKREIEPETEEYAESEEIRASVASREKNDTAVNPGNADRGDFR